MNCPYCNQEMRLGYIEAQNLLSWTPKEEKSIGLTLWARSLNSIKLAGFPFIRAASVDAYYCSNCQKIIIDIP